VAVIIGAVVGCKSYREVPQDNGSYQTNQITSDENCLFGCPLGKPNNKIIKREIYTLSNNAETKFADWVAYHVTTNSIGPSKDRNWKADPELPPEETLEPDDYRGANAELKTDRGHQAPLASFSGTQYWEMTNYLSNITPQKSNLNQGSWVRLEAAVRDAVRDDKGLYVVTGPLYEKAPERLPNADEKHVVPSGYWKVVASESGGMIAFIFDQDLPRSADYCDQVVSLSIVEQRSGFDLFPEIINQGIENAKLNLACN
jgi:endonuclease G, mitochondrial